jgi:hypothetical protein
MHRYLLLCLFSLVTSGPLPASGSPITLSPGDGVVIRKVAVTDCRAVRGFIGNPVDGSVHSWNYNGRPQEYPQTASDGVVYSFNHNDGLHLTLADGDGFDVVVLRGGARGRLYANVSGLVEPPGVKPLCEFAGGEGVQTMRLERRVRTGKVSVFGVQGGTAADISFYRIERGTARVRVAEEWRPGEPVTLPQPASAFAPESLARAMSERYAESDRRTLALVRGPGAGQPLACRKGRAVHFLLPPVSEEQGLAGVTLEAQVAGTDRPVSFTAAVQDPLDPRLDLAWVECAAGPGALQLGLDVPDQVLLKGSQVWLTLRCEADVTLAGPEGGAPVFRLHAIPREEALPEALSRRKFLLKNFFYLLSEPRPWGAYRGQPREAFFASSPYARQCPELFMTIDQCFALAPADDTVRQYREWVYLRSLPALTDVGPPPEPPAGVPAWAWYPRMAWLETRRIAEWWLDERLAPTGEFGGRVGDDSDLYQQFADLPFFESGGVAARLRASAAQLAELADRENLREGINIHSTDSLHAYEEGINHLALMARWHYGDPIYVERCMDSARNMEKLTILTPDGRRHFRDTEKMGVADLEKPHPPAVDGGPTALMWHSALQLADYNRSPRALKLLREWADTWLRFQKPGQWATAVEVLSGKVLESAPDRPLYGGYRTQACAFTWLYALTGDKRYLEPFLHYYRQGQAPAPADAFLGDAWSLGALQGLDAKTRMALAARNPAGALYLNGDAQPLVQATIGGPRTGQSEIATLHDARRWRDMYTEAHQFTDRVFPSLVERASVAHLGGFCRRNKYNPTLAVSWEGLGPDYGALVLVNQPERLKVAVYSFAERPLSGKMRVWALEHGRYHLTVGPDANGDSQIDKASPIRRAELTKGDAIDVTLPPGAVTVIELQQEARLAPVTERADLAIAAREVQPQGNTLRGTVHNIGSADAADAVVAVVDAAGRTVARQSLGRLPAPVDLVPRRLPFILSLPRRSEKGWKLVLDPDRRVPEIYEGNNQVALDALKGERP